jgi:hypothetical protein
MWRESSREAAKALISNSCITMKILTIAMGATLAGCMTTASLQPAPGAQVAEGEPDAAVAEEHGIEVIVDPNEWTAFPRELNREMTPVRATIVNKSDQPLEIKYEHFALSGVEGVTYHPLPPIDIQGTVTRIGRYPVVAPRFAFSGFYLAPYYDPYFVGMNPWVYDWPYDPIYYRRYYPRWDIDLPTHEMIELAIPEGVIEPKGRVSGFLYFPELEQADAGDQVTFTANLVNARTDASFGRVGVPFVVE